MTPKTRKQLKERHKMVLEVIQKYRDKHGYAPSYREICARTDITSTSMVNYYLEQLEEMGYIERSENISRSIKIIGAAQEKVDRVLGNVKQAVQDVSRSLTIPIVGRIVASEPIPIPETDFSLFDAESNIDIPESLIPFNIQKENLFALEVDGDSMIDAMVNDGDVIIMKPVQEAKNGEMVAVRFKDRNETTLKHFYREGDRVRLQPANPTMDPIYVDSSTEIEVQGKVVLVIRQI
ncbi:MAG: repressor LexA [Anaerolineales bacterium]|jgi:repressor LexA|nr:repressor LexA [Anaerolineales bacterium]